MGTWPVMCACILLTVSSSARGDNVHLFWNLYDAVISGGRILHDVAEGVGAVSKAIKAIDMFLETTSEIKKMATKEDDKDETTTEGKTSEQQPNPSIPPPDPELDAATPSFSGCGALGFHIRDETLPITRLTECCGTHDACYGSACRVNKRDCDGKLKSCLYSVCDDRSLDKGKQKTCRGAAKLLFSGTMALSFQQYNTAQEKLSCRPPKGKDADKKRRRR